MVKIRAIDLFCGAGGSSWGARSAGVEIVAGFDMWETARNAYQDNFPQARVYGGRLEDVDLAAVKAEMGEINLILASPECTNHSPAKGNRPRCEASKATAFQVTRFAREFCPRWVVVENVVSMRRWTRYAEFLAELGSLGYKVSEQVLNAADFGVPQRRRRLLILCDREAEPSKMAPTVKRRKPASRIIDRNGTYRYSPLLTERRAEATLQRANRALAALGPNVAFLLVYYGSDGGGGWQRLDRPLRTITTLDRFALVKPDPEHGHVMRMLQVPELRAAMGMPRSFSFRHGTRRDKIGMIGNAVCPKVMQAVVTALCTEG